MKRWQHYGIALSVAWTFGVTGYIRYQELPKAQDYATRAYFKCTERKTSLGRAGTDICLEKVSDDWDEWMNRQWGRIALTSLLPASAGWLATYAGIWLSRRYRSARRP